MVDPIRPVRVTGPRLTRGAGAAASYDRFQVDESRQATVETPHVSAAPAIGLDSLLMLQGIDDSVERDRGARKRGSAMIAALSDLQRAMLAAEDPALTLQALSDLAAEEPDAADPALASVLRAVVLRARLEVARRGRRGD
jgi:Class II flagellar assembly regulator